MNPRATLSLLTLAAVALCAWIVWPFFHAIVGATVLAVLFHPLQRRLCRLLGRPSLAAVLATIAILLLVLAPAIALGFAAAAELRAAYTALKAQPVDDFATQILEWISRRTGVETPDVRAMVLDKLNQAASSILNGAKSLITAFTAGIVQLVVAFITLFFLLRDGRTITRHLALLLPLPPAQVEALLERATETILANLYGMVAVAAAQGVAMGLGVSFTHLPSPMLWGIAAALFSVVPVIGSSAIWIPAALVSFSSGHWGEGLFLLAWGAGVVGMLDNIVRPWVVSERVKLHPLLVFLSLLGGMATFGFAGIFLGPVAVSLAVALVRLLAEQVRANS